MINTNSAGDPNALRVALRSGGVEQVTQPIVTSPGSGWQLLSSVLDSKSARPELALIVKTTLDAQISALSVIKDGAVMDFDTADKRFNWRNDNTDGRARHAHQTPTFSKANLTTKLNTVRLVPATFVTYVKPSTVRYATLAMGKITNIFPSTPPEISRTKLKKVGASASMIVIPRAISESLRMDALRARSKWT